MKLPAKHLSGKEDKGGDGSADQEEESHKTIARRTDVPV